MIATLGTSSGHLGSFELVILSFSTSVRKQQQEQQSDYRKHVVDSDTDVLNIGSLLLNYQDFGPDHLGLTLLAQLEQPKCFGTK